MLVGHLSHLSHLASRLLGLDLSRTVVRFRTGGVVRLGRDETAQWGVRWDFSGPSCCRSTSLGSNCSANALRDIVYGE
jgi:phosphohistidine phosphatase SixA